MPNKKEEDECNIMNIIPSFDERCVIKKYLILFQLILLNFQIRNTLFKVLKKR